MTNYVTNNHHFGHSIIHCIFSGGGLGIITCTLLHSAHAHEHTKSIELISEKTLS